MAPMTDTPFTPKMSAPELDAFFRAHFPDRLQMPVTFEGLTRGNCTLRLAFREEQLRPGRTIAGPVLMALADTAVYVLLLTHVGAGVAGVTTSLHMDFLRRPEARDTIAHAELLRLGRTALVGRVTITSEGDLRPVAHATVTYALPVATPDAAR